MLRDCHRTPHCHQVSFYIMQQFLYSNSRDEDILFFQAGLSRFLRLTKRLVLAHGITQAECGATRYRSLHRTHGELVTLPDYKYGLS